METAILFMLCLLGLAVVWIAASLKNYQRVDYSRILEQDDYMAQLDARIAYLEELIALQQQDFSAREQQLEAQLAAMQRSTAQLADAQRRSAAPAASESAAASPLPQPGPPRSVAGRPRPTAQPTMRTTVALPVRKTVSSRQLEIAELLASGQPPDAIAGRLGISRHEVDLVAALAPLGVHSPR